jgi:hypothetical protein
MRVRVYVCVCVCDSERERERERGREREREERTRVSGNGWVIIRTKLCEMRPDLRSAVQSPGLFAMLRATVYNGDSACMYFIRANFLYF